MAQDSNERNGKKQRTIVTIDGNSLMHRAFHAVPTTMTTPQGVHTNAVFGFVSMLLKLIDTLQPDGIVCAFDAGIPQFRFDAISRYKAQRPPTDPDLKEQFPLIRNILEAMAIPIVSVEGYEGDDVLGTLAAKGDALGIKTMIVSGDRDIFQLASDNTSVVSTRTGMTDVKIYGPAEVRERYGIGPELVPDFIGLKGDTSDNIPGVPGVGEKTAAKLLQLYGSAQGIIEHKDEIKGKVGQNIADNIDLLEAGIKVATIVRDLDIDIDLEGIVFPSFDPDAVIAAFRALGINAHVSKILALKPDEARAATEAVVEHVEIITGADAVQALGQAVSDGSPVAALIADASQEQLFGESVTLAVATPAGVCLFHDGITGVLAGMVGATTVVTTDAKQLLQQLVPVDSSQDALIDLAQVDASTLFDLSIAAYLLDSQRGHYEIDHLVFEYMGVHLPERPKPKRGHETPQLTDEELALRARYALELRQVLRARLEADGSLDCFERIEMPLVPVLVGLERQGLEIDVEFANQLSLRLGNDIEALQGRIYDLAGMEFNISSPKQLAEVLFEKLGLPARKKTRRGYSTDASVLEGLADMNPVPGLVLEYRELSKLKNTYLDTLPALRRRDGRIHTTFNQTITATGRLSSSDPNLQNIPVRSELGRQIRMAFRPYSSMSGVDGHEAVFLSADYSQIELRLLAHLSGDEGLISAFMHGSDFHTSTAARIFGIQPHEVTPALRSRAKAVNFGIVYGQQAFGLGKSLHIPLHEAQEMIDRYFSAYPQVKAYLDGLVEQAREQGFVQTLFGRKRHVPEIHASNAMQRQAGERVAMNHPMQGSAADIIKLAMINVARRLESDGFESVMLLQVHDELDFSCPKAEIERLSKMVAGEMRDVVSLRVPLEVSVSFGPTWADAK